MNYLLSIIIPTKDRYKYLTRTIKNLSKLDAKSIEIIIQDNTINNYEIIQVIKQINHENIKYFHDTRMLSQTENSNLALEHATGEYCCYIGDDDSVLPDLIEKVKYLKEKHIEACAIEEANYYWPDVVFEKKRPWLKFNTKKCREKLLNSKKILRASMSYGMQDIALLPRVYHGVVSKKILNQIYEKTGTYFPGPSPDMANAVACALLIKYYLHTEKPLIFSGVGFTSGAGMGQRGAHKGDLKNGKQLPIDAEEKWSKRIPKLWLGYTVWAESAEKSMIAMGNMELLKHINIEAMEAKIFLKYSEYRKAMIERISNPMHFIKFTWECIRFGFKYIYAETRLYLRNKFGFVNIISSPIEFEEAYNLVSESNLRIKEVRK